LVQPFGLQVVLVASVPEGHAQMQLICPCLQLYAQKFQSPYHQKYLSLLAASTLLLASFSLLLLFSSSLLLLSALLLQLN
ncbi:hypothetical protein A2U01_0057722, partial [Trifolium medium]|nr:hypothetical protein [Trifolium medium]